MPNVIIPNINERAQRKPKYPPCTCFGGLVLHNTVPERIRGALITRPPRWCWRNVHSCVRTRLNNVARLRKPPTTPAQKCRRCTATLHPPGGGMVGNYCCFALQNGRHNAHDAHARAHTLWKHVTMETRRISDETMKTG